MHLSDEPQFAAILGLKKHVLTPFSMFFTSLGEQKRNAEFHYSDLIGGDLCSKMAYLIAKSGGNKG